MLGLNLRPEFRSKRISGTVIEISNAQNTGATQRPAEFLAISYLTSDLLSAIEAVGLRASARVLAKHAGQTPVDCGQ